MQRGVRAALLAGIAGVILSGLAPPLLAQEGARTLAGRAKFVTIHLAAGGPAPAEFRAEPGQPLVVLVRNSDQVAHCLLFDIPPGAQYPEIAGAQAAEPPSLECPVPPARQPAPTGRPATLAVDLESLKAVLQCGPRGDSGRASGYWGYRLPRPLAPGEVATLCFLVSSEGRYPYYDPRVPTEQGVLVVGTPEVSAQPTALPSTATVSPATAQPPGTLPQAGGPAQQPRPRQVWLVAAGLAAVLILVARAAR